MNKEPLFRKKHYIFIAAALKECKQFTGDIYCPEAAIALKFKADNPKFDAQKFLAACE